MTSDLLLDRARELWTELAVKPVEFSSLDGANVVVSPGSRLCPPLWTGIVVLGGAGIVTVPSVQVAKLMAGASRKLSDEELVDEDRLREVLPVLDVLGPAALFYLARADFLPVQGGAAVEEAVCGDDELAALLARAGEEDAGESGLEDITSPAFVLRENDGVVAAAGYQDWPQSVAHLSVLVAPGHRGRGLARVVASAAVAHALDAGLLPQWRARPHRSKRVALGLERHVPAGPQRSAHERAIDGKGQVKSLKGSLFEHTDRCPHHVPRVPVHRMINLRWHKLALIILQWQSINVHWHRSPETFSKT